MGITWDCFKSTTSDLKCSMSSSWGHTPGTVLRQIRCLYLLKSACINAYSAWAVSYDTLIFSKCAVSYWSGGNATRVTNLLPRALKGMRWLSVLLLYLLVTIWSFYNSIHPSGFKQLLGTRVEIVLFFHDTLAILNTFLVQGNIITLFLLVLLAYFNVDGVQQDSYYVRT